MQCEQAQRALSDARYAQDGGAGGTDATDVTGAESDERAALRAHLAQCPACRALQGRHAALDMVLALAEPVVASADFDTSFFARLELERARTRRRKRLGIAAALLPLAAAAVVGIAVMRDRMRAPEPMILTQLPASDVELALDLDLVEDLAVVEHMDEIEAYELLGQVDEAELERILKETR